MDERIVDRASERPHFGEAQQGENLSEQLRTLRHEQFLSLYRYV